MPRVENPLLTEALALQAEPLPAPPDTRVAPDNKTIAIRMADNVEAKWFICSPISGGVYSNDEAIESWQPMIGDPGWPAGGAE